MFLSPNMLIVIINILKYIILFIFAFGLWLIIFPYIKPTFHKSKKFRFKNLNSDDAVTNIKFINEINRLILVSTNNNSRLFINSFYFVSILLFILALFATINAHFNFLLSIAFSIFTGLLPYIFLKIRLRKIRVSASWEAQITITELINQYKINFLNMFEALRKTETILYNNSYTKKAIIRLVKDLSIYQTKDDLQKAIDDFVYAFDTQWAIELGNNIYLSIEYGDNVSDSLDNLINELKDLNDIAEDRKKLNNESFIMIKFATPISYIGTVFVIFKNFHFTFIKFIEYQFINQLGLKFFILTILSIIFNFIIYDIFKKQKNDF